MGRSVSRGGDATLNVCHIIVALNVGGAERMLQRLVLAQRQDLEVRHSVLSLSTLGPVGQELRQAGVSVTTIGIESAKDVPGGLLRLLRALRALRPDVVQTWMYHADLLGGIVARIAGVKGVVWGVHSTELVADRAGTAQYARWACARVSGWIPYRIVCVARASQLRHEAAGYSAARIRVIHNGFDVRALTPLDESTVADVRRSIGLAPEDLVVGFAGRFVEAKDVGNFVAAATLVARQHPRARFLMMGRGIDAGNTSLFRAISEAGVADRFVLLGERSDAPRCIGTMDVFCLSSKTEAFPIVVGEAMSMSVPCVVTDVGDAAAMVADTGIAVPKQNPVALADGLGRMLAMTSEERDRLGVRARQRVVSEYSIESVVKAYDALYRDAAALTRH